MKSGGDAVAEMGTFHAGERHPIHTLDFELIDGWNAKDELLRTDPISPTSEKICWFVVWQCVTVSDGVTCPHRGLREGPGWGLLDTWV